MKLLEITGLSLNYSQKSSPSRQRLQVLDNLDVNLDRGEILALVGSSGCGKTSLLRILAGLQKPSSCKNIRWQDQPSSFSKVATQISYMPQTHSLLPWLKVIDNVALPLTLQKNISRDEAKEKAYRLLKAFGLQRFIDSYPQALSGGMASRVAFLRANITEPPLLLLDEPFAALDEITRETAQDWLHEAWNSERSGIFVTHSLSEAVVLADRVLVMGKRGRPLSLNLNIDLPRTDIGNPRANPLFSEYVNQVRQALRNQ